MSGRLLFALLAAFAGFLHAAWRAIRQLIHEMTGALFALFAVLGGISTWREWQKGSALWILAATFLFALTMAFFAVSSFLRARRVR